jgi:hypothetical protein
MSLKPTTNTLDTAWEYFNYGPNTTDKVLLSELVMAYLTPPPEMRYLFVKRVADEYARGVLNRGYPETKYGFDLLHGLQSDDLTRTAWEVRFGLTIRGRAHDTCMVQDADGANRGSFKLTIPEIEMFLDAGYQIAMSAGFPLPGLPVEPEPDTFRTTEYRPPEPPLDLAEIEDLFETPEQVAERYRISTQENAIWEESLQRHIATGYDPDYATWLATGLNGGTATPCADPADCPPEEVERKRKIQEMIDRQAQAMPLVIPVPMLPAGALSHLGLRLAALGRNKWFWTGVGTTTAASARFLGQAGMAAGSAAIRRPTPFLLGAGALGVLSTLREDPLKAAAIGIGTIGGLMLGDHLMGKFGKKNQNGVQVWAQRKQGSGVPRAGVDETAALISGLTRYRKALDAEPNSAAAYVLSEQYELGLLREPSAHQALIDHAPCLVSIKGPPDWQPFRFWTPDGLIIDDSHTEHDEDALVRRWLDADHTPDNGWATPCNTCLDSSIADPLLRNLDAPVPRRAEFYRSGMVTAELDDMPRGIYGEIDFDQMPYRIRVNRGAVNSRIRLAYVHEMVHAIDEQAKFGISHDQIHALAMYILNEILPGYLALDTHLAGEMQIT